MKKLMVIISCFTILLFSNAYASIVTFAMEGGQRYDGQDYVGEIVGAMYKLSDTNEQQELMIFTLHDGKCSSNLQGLTLIIDQRDFPFGLTLANSVGKKIAVTFANADYKIQNVYLVTDRFWYSKKLNFHTEKSKKY